MDDFVVRVKQIAQHPFVSEVAPADAILLQRGGLGGPYLWTTPKGLTGALAARIDASEMRLTLLTNTFNKALEELAERWTAELTGSLAALTGNTVWSFNGRRGPVVLAVADVANLGFARVNSPVFFGIPLAPTAPNPWQQDYQLATTAFVANAIAANLDQLLCQPPFAALMAGKPTALTPPWHDSSTRLATTRFVEREVTSLAIDLKRQIGDLSALVAAEIDQSALATKAYVNATFAPLADAALAGSPTSTTPPPGDNGARIATTAFVMSVVAESTAGVASFNSRTGNVVFTAQDLAAANGAALTSPVFDGVPTAPTATTGTDTQQLATCAFVLNEVQALSAGVVSFNTRSGAVTLQASDLAPFNLAPLASPALTGVPTAPTATPATLSSNQIATCAFVQAAMSQAAGVASFEGRTGAVLLTANDISARGGALLASPAFTGAPTAPTAASGTATTQLATTAFVAAAIAASSGVSSFNGRSGAVLLTAADVTAAGGVLASALTGYLPLTGGTLTGPLSVNTTGAAITTTNASLGTAQLLPGMGFISTRVDNAAVGASWGPFVSLVRLRGTSAAPSPVLSGDWLGSVNFGGQWGAAAANSDDSKAAIYAVSMENWSSTARGCKVLIGASIAGYAGNASSHVYQFQVWPGPIQAFDFGPGRFAIQQLANGATFLYPLQSNTSVTLWMGPGGDASISGNFSAANFPSDPRLKKDVSPYARGLAAVRALNPTRWRWNGLGGTRDDGELHYGLMADEMERVAPEAVVERERGIGGGRTMPVRGIEDKTVIAMLVNAVKELTARLEILEGGV